MKRLAKHEVRRVVKHGRLIGQIELLSGLLKEQVKPLKDLSVEELALIADDLQSKLRERGV